MNITLLCIFPLRNSSPPHFLLLCAIMLESKINKDIANGRQKAVDSDEKQERRVFSKAFAMCPSVSEKV